MPVVVEDVIAGRHRASGLVAHEGRRGDELRLVLVVVAGVDQRVVADILERSPG